MADLLSRSHQVQSTEWSLLPQVFRQICQKWFTPHVDMFATHLNHKLPLYVSPIPDPQAWDIDALNINWTGLTAYAYPPTALLYRVIQKICLCLPSTGSPLQGDPKNQSMPLPDHSNSPRLARDALVLGPSAALNRDPATTSSVNNTTQTVPQLRISQQSATSQPPRLVSRSGQLQEQGFSVEVAERIAAPQRSSTRTVYNMYLGPVVAAQQILDPSSQHPHLREEKKRAHASCIQVFRSLSQGLSISYPSRCSR